MVDKYVSLIVYPFALCRAFGRGVCNMPLHFRKKIRFPWVGITYCLGQSETNTYLIPSCLIGYQIGTHVGAQKHTPPARLSSTPTPFAGHLVGHMQYAPTLSEKDEVSLGRYYLLYRTIRDKSVFLFFIPNRLSDRYPCRGVLHTPSDRFNVYPFALCRAFGGA